jgi:hypothetical protein
MGRRVNDNVVHVECGEAVDIEAVVRLRQWIEDIISEKVEFSKTNLITDYDRERQLFGFKIVFIG